MRRGRPYLNDEEYNGVLGIVMRWIASLQNATLGRSSARTTRSSASTHGLGNHFRNGSCRHHTFTISIDGMRYLLSGQRAMDIA